jgi:hypothetical protein
MQGSAKLKTNIVQDLRIMSMKNSSDTIGNQTQYPLRCFAVPRSPVPSGPPLVHH